MRERMLCLMTWTIAAGVLTGVYSGALSGSHGQCDTNTGPALLIAEEKQNLSFTAGSMTNSTSCQWFIRSYSISTRLRLTVDTFALRSANGSCVDNFTVYDGISSNSPILLSTCFKPDFPIYSSGSYVLVAFTSGNDDSGKESKFVLNYEPNNFNCSSIHSLSAISIPRDLRYSSDLPVNSTDICWTIESYTGTTIRINFTYVQMDSCADDNCTCDTVVVFDGIATNGKRICEICGEDQQHVFDSSSNLLQVILHLSFAYTRRHFLLTYQRLGRKDNSSADIVNVVYNFPHIFNYPQESSLYPNNANRAWIFKSRYDIILLKFTKVDVEPSPNGCDFDYIEIFDNSRKANKMDRLCGTLTSRQYYSTGQSLYIAFHSDGSRTRTGFNLTYETVPMPRNNLYTDCDNKNSFTAHPDFQHLFKYPAPGAKYPDNTDCVWTFQSSEKDYIVHVTFLFVDIEMSYDGCAFDYVEIFDNSSSASKRLGTICGNQTQQEFYSSGESLFITFHSDNINTGSGFYLFYDSVPQSKVTRETAVCGPPVILNASSEVQYLNYPEITTTYPNNADCAWIFQTNNSELIVSISFVYIDVEPSAFGCENDYIEVFDGSSQQTKLGRLCGAQESQLYFSSGLFMYITFHSNSDETRTGFRLSYNTVLRSTLFNRTACATNMLLSAAHHSQQYLHYTNGDSDNNNIDCGWLLQTTSSDYLVHVNLMFVYTEDWRGYSPRFKLCLNNYVEVYDGSPSPIRRLAILCGQPTNPWEFFSSGRSLFIKFHMNDKYYGQGFHLFYRAVRPSEAPEDVDGVCLHHNSRVVNLNPQYLKYPSTSINYANNAECSWLLQTTSDDYVVHVTFTFVDIEDKMYCAFDYVELFDGIPPSVSSLGKVCQLTAFDFYSRGPSMYIKFHSDLTLVGRGFQLTYQAISKVSATTCPVNPDVHIPWTSLDHFLQFPTTSTDYPNDINCSWLFTAEVSSYVVHLTFTYINIEVSTACSSDYVQVFDGANDSSVSLGKLCGYTSRDFTSSGQSMYIRFHSDGAVTGTGFRLTYRAVSQPSGSVSRTVVVGAVVGSIAFLFVVVVVMVLVRRHRIQQSTRNSTRNTNNHQNLAYLHPGDGFASNAGPLSVGAGPPRVTSGPPRVTSGPPRATSGPPRVTSGPPHATSDPPRVTSGPPHVTSGPPHVTSGPSHVISGPSHVISGPPHVNSSPPHVTSGPSRVTSGPSDVTSGPSDVTSDPSHVTSDPSHVTSGSSNVTASSRHVTTAPRQVTSGPPYVTSGLPHVTSGSPHVTSGSSHITSGPPHVISGPPHVTSGPSHVTFDPPSDTTGPPPYYVACQATDGSYPGASVNGAHTLSIQQPQNSQNLMTAESSSSTPSDTQETTGQEHLSMRL